MPYKRLDVGKQLHWLGLLGVIVVALGLYGLAEDGNDPHTADDALALENTHHTIDLDILTRPADPTVSADPASADLPSPPPLPAAAIVSLPEPPIITPALAPASDATPITPPPPMADTPTAAEDTRPDNLAAIAKPVDAGGDHDQADAAPSTPDVEIPPKPEPKSSTFTVKKGDTLDGIFRKAALSYSDLLKVMALDPAKQHLHRIFPGDELTFMLDPSETILERFSYPIDRFRTLVISRQHDGFAATIESAKKEIRTATAQSTITSSLYNAAKNVGLSEKVVADLVKIFGWDIDFALDIRSGDTFSVVYEAIYRNGEHIADGNVLAAEFVNRGQPSRAIRFEDQRADVTGYFDPLGRPMRKAFLRTPVQFSHISSRFQLKRWHPVLKQWRAHRGVDYAARTGTPVYATGDGKISKISRMRGYGNVIMIEHGMSYLTVYAHLSRFAKGMKPGTKVKQGQTIGYVGATGYATGPHLHYEFRVSGRHTNPLTVKLPGAKPLPKALRDTFRRHAKTHLVKLDRLAQTVVAKSGD